MSSMGKLGAGITVLGVTAGMLLVAPPLAAATGVDSEAALRSAFFEPEASSVTLTADIDLTDCVEGPLARDSAGPITLHGGGHTLRQTCSGARVINNAHTGPMTIENLTLANTADPAGQTSPAVTSTGPLTVTGSHFAAMDGGALNGAGDVTVGGSTFTGVSAHVWHGGAITAGGEVTVIDSRFTENTARTTGGGAIHAKGRVEVVNSRLINNNADDDGGAIHALSDVSVTGSALIGNSTGGMGGAIFATGTVTVANSTLAANAATGHGSAARASGDLSLLHATVARNSGPAQLSLSHQANLTSFGSVVAEPTSGANCGLASAANSSYSYDTDGTCGFDGTGDTSGGEQPGYATIAGDVHPDALEPPAGSPLIDAIPAGDCHAEIGTDQQGVSRPQGSGCDIGSVEVEAAGIGDGGPRTGDGGRDEPATGDPVVREGAPANGDAVADDEVARTGATTARWITGAAAGLILLGLAGWLLYRRRLHRHAGGQEWP